MHERRNVLDNTNIATQCFYQIFWVRKKKSKIKQRLHKWSTYSLLFHYFVLTRLPWHAVFAISPNMVSTFWTVLQWPKIMHSAFLWKTKVRFSWPYMVLHEPKHFQVVRTWTFACLHGGWASACLKFAFSLSKKLLLEEWYEGQFGLPFIKTFCT